jgi:hypothetical protein
MIPLQMVVKLMAINYRFNIDRNRQIGLAAWSPSGGELEVVRAAGGE